MKRTISLIALLLAFAILLSACVGQPEDTIGSTEGSITEQTEPSTNKTEPTTEETAGNTASSTEETAPNTEPVNIEDIEGPLAQYVQTAVKETFELDTTKFHNPKQSVTVRIPKLLPFSEDAIACQGEIQNEFDPWVEEIRTNLTDGFTSATAFIDYYAYLNDRIFSLVIYAESMFDLGLYRVYNFDTETGKRLNTEELMNKLQITDYTERFTQIAQDAFSKQWGETRDPSSHDYDLYVSQKAKNSSKENIDKAMPYVAEDGKVMVVLNVYSLAGAEKYPQVLPVS